MDADLTYRTCQPFVKGSCAKLAGFRENDGLQCKENMCLKQRTSNPAVVHIEHEMNSLRMVVTPFMYCTLHV